MKKTTKIIIVLAVILLAAAGIIAYSILKENNRDFTIGKEDLVNFDDQYAEGIISADEYVKGRLEEKNQDPLQIHLRDFAEEHIDELSDETIEMLYENMTIEKMMGIKVDEEQKEASLTDVVIPTSYAEKDEPDKKIIMSPKKRFMIWYNEEGDYSCSTEMVNKIASTLDETCDKYDEIFNVKYKFESELISEGPQYFNIIDDVKANKFTEDDFKSTMQVYINVNNDAIATYNHKVVGFDIIKSGFKGVDYSGSVVLPYIVVSAPDISDNLEYALQVMNHELFHHYQFKVFTQEYGKEISYRDCEESTANWASSLVSEKTNDNGYLNNYVAMARYTPNLLTDDESIEKYTRRRLSYALFPYLYHYSENVPNGIIRIKDSMYQDDFWKSLLQDIKLEDLNDLQESYMFGLLAQKYDNMNLIFNPKEHDDIKYRKTFDFEHGAVNTSDDIDVTLNQIGVEYYKIIPNGEYKFKIDFYRETESVVAYLVGEKDGEFTELDGFDYGYDVNYTFNNDAADYDTYYFMVGNSSAQYKWKYSIRFTKEKIEAEEEEIEDAEEDSEMEKANWVEKLIHGKEVTREDLPKKGYLTFSPRYTMYYDDYELDSDVTNRYDTYYYDGNDVTRIVITKYFREDITDDVIQLYVDDIINNPKMYKSNYIQKGFRLISEYTEANVKIADVTVEQLLREINQKNPTMHVFGDFVSDFTPEL